MAPLQSEQRDCKAAAGESVEVASCEVRAPLVAASAGDGVTHVGGAFVAVVAHAVVTSVLGAEASHADSRQETLEIAIGPIRRRRAATSRAPVADVLGAGVDVVFAHDARAQVTHSVATLPGRATDRAARSGFDR